jgi:CAAX protease family protein
MDAATQQCRTAKPYGFVGLSLSLPVIAILTIFATFILGGAGALLAGPIMGWPAFLDRLRESLSGGATSADRRTIFALLIIIHLALCVSIWAVARWRGGVEWRSLLAWRPFRLTDRIFWVIILAALIYSAVAGDALSHFMTNPSDQLKVADPVGSVEMLILAALVAPLAEELLFRGWIYTGLRFYWGFWPALLVTSILFSLAHYESTHLYSLAVFPIALALGFVRERTDSIKATILFHALNNLAAFCLAAFGGS